MESDILKFICANQGAVDADELMFNLFPGASTNEVISNQLKFVLYSSNGQQKVVAKTSLKLCRIKDCLGSCGQLHLCKNLLFSGLCQRRVCGFCHELNSCYNQWLLKQHELEALSRAELCTLLLQSDNTLLPPICYDYNTGYDEFGRCQSGVACSRLHICKKYLSGDCRCPKSHDFFAPQPLKSLYDRGVPDTLIRSLRSVYANNEALRISSNRSTASPTYTTATSEVGLHLDKRQGHRGRGRGRGGNSGHRGYKGNSENRGKLLQPQQPSSCSYLLGNTDGFTLYSKKSLNEYGNVQEDLNSSSSDLSTAGSDTKSRDRRTVKPRHRNRQKHGGTRGSRGKGTNLGNPPQQQQSDSLNDVPANSDASDLNTEGGPNEEDNRQREPNSPSSDAPTVGKDASAESGSGFKVEQIESNQGRETGGNKGNGTNLGNPSQQQQSASLNDAPANSDASDLNIEDKLNEGDRQQLDLNSPSSDVSAAGKDINTKSNNGFMVVQRQWNQGREDSGGNAGQSLQQQQTSALSDISADVCSLDLNGKAGLSVGDSRQQGLNSAKSNVLAGGTGTDRSNSSGQSRQQAKDPNPASAITGRGGEQDNQQQQLHRSSPADLSAAADSKDRNSGDVLKKKQKPVKDKTEICMHFIKGYCKHDDRCVKAHDRMPYRWQVLEGGLWTNLPHNEAIEKDYCDPKNKHSGSPVVHFDTMTSGANRIRRLSTLNSLVEPDFIHTTEWLWYWQDEFGKWNLYGSDNRHDSADISSSKLEKKFLDNEKDVVDFRAGSQSYTLSFQDMIQTNKYYGTKKLVSRRPLFVSAEDVKTKKVRKSSNSTSVPDTWDKTQIPQTRFSRVALQRSSDEYLKVEALFCSTMKGFDIIEIERIQNKALWEVFQWQKNLMKNNNGGRDVTERLLFHGTELKYVDAICLNNFDWRICGTHGTVYGKGSYFARDAMYSHCYTGDTPVRTMFVSRVLLGSYTRGASSYVRPPSKDGGDVHFYDSCVDNVADPSIFVVFEKHQIYPEYLIQYLTAEPLNDTSGSNSAAPAPTQCVIT
ncbi:protein mono-ADP-ribosyltransferase PARP12-like isoform X2 [Kryptolebias marmoratus]|uniref:protein mono-ADP-ribosyltransferase PARP12-like isoform X2 n=1 Tax=Kryptolebias marmoratus TaxID=37003 RepID=UPI0018ACCCC6|nr:protein mono-ADP-ribosyltransferase PARP12-like isoform X2 [Kryptolebias marmoratus]